ncbi:hypothetical protein OFC13_27880, partial [Escherichia coli]|nr:hypothetical protein [Escherichia coli]
TSVNHHYLVEQTRYQPPVTTKQSATARSCFQIRIRIRPVINAVAVIERPLPSSSFFVLVRPHTPPSRHVISVSAAASFTYANT